MPTTICSTNATVPTHLDPLSVLLRVGNGKIPNVVAFLAASVNRAPIEAKDDVRRTGVQV